ncbi:MAG: PD40 domain-containing protein [Actinobacteria bacterium]|nr:PD40 domain-containing protein [Actinomycetota bacterium]
MILPLLLLLVFVPALVLFFHSAPAESAHPGYNGKVVFTSSRDGYSEIYSMNTDGSGVPTNLTNNGATLDIDPAWSPDASRIAYSSGSGINAEIWVMNADGSGQTRLTTDTAWDVTPAWSPDGTKIAFASDRAGGGNWEIYMMDANGSGLTRMTNSLGNDGGPSWSPDGTMIAFNSDRDGNVEIYIMNVEDRALTRLTTNTSWDAYPDWAPDGTKLAFESDRDGNYEIYTLNTADSTQQTRLTSNSTSDNLPAWSPDGSKIAFYSFRDGNTEVYTMNADGSGQTNLTSNLASDESPDWQPALAPTVLKTPPGANGKIVFSSNYDLFSMNADGSGLTSITSTPTVGEESPDFTPDGSAIAFSCLTNNFAICGMIASGGPSVTFTTRQYDREPAYSPDGGRVAFSSNRDGNQEIYVIDLNNASETRLTRNTSGDYDPDFSPDGSKIVFQSIRDGSSEIYIMNADGSVQTRLTTQAELQNHQNYSPVFSPDGSKIVFYSGYGLEKRDICLMNADGSGLLNLTNSSTEDDVNPTWSPDGSKLVFMKYDVNASNSDIHVMNADGSGQTLLTSDRQGFLHAAWQPLPNYHWTWYDDIGGNNWVLMANPASAGKSLTYQLSINGDPRDLSTFSDGVVAPGGSITPSYGDRGGPVVATSSAGGRGVVSQRILWPRGGSSIEEVLGTDRGRLSSHFYWTWYDQLSDGYQNWIMVANPSATETVRAEILIAGQPMLNTLIGNPGYGQTYFEIAPDANVTPTFPGMRNGPVEVRAYRDGGSWYALSDHRVVMASQRVLSGNGSAFNEAVGVPVEELASDYYWPWYDDVNGLNWLMMSNPNIAPAMYRIDIGGGCDINGVWNGTPNTICQTGMINGGEIIFQRLGVVNGPVHVYTLNGVSIIASQRILFGSSFGETMGYPAADLAATYHWTWYDQQTAGMANWVMIANPSTTQTIDVQVWMAGQQAQEDVGVPTASPTTWTLLPGERITPRFGNYIGGPVEVRAFVSGTTTPAPGGAIVSQRVLYNGFFNEVLGTVIN